MLDLWESLTGNLFRIYEKRKQELYDDSQARLLNRHQQIRSREKWTHISTSPKLHKHDNRNDTIEAIVARTQAILAKSTENSVAEKIDLWKYNQMRIERGEIELNERNVITSSMKPTYPFDASPTKDAIRGVAKGPYLNQVKYPPQRDISEEDVANDIMPLVQKVGISVENRKRVLAESSDLNAQFRSMGAANTALLHGRMTDEDAAESKLPPASTVADRSPTTYPQTLPRKKFTGNSTEKEAYEDVAIDWDKVKKQVAEELAAKDARDAKRYKEQRNFDESFEEGVRKIIQQERPFRSDQVREIDTKTAAQRSAEAIAAAAATIDSNKAFEVLVAGEGPRMVPVEEQ